MKRLSHGHELLDGPLDDALLAGNLRDLARFNRLLGGAGLSWRAVSHLLATSPAADPVTVLDVGTGGADVPLALVRRARRQGRQLAVEGLDTRPEIVAAATRATVDEPCVKVHLTTPPRLPHDDGSFDIAHVSLVIHHQEPADARLLLGELRRVARLGVIVNDLDRARRWWLAVWLLTRVATANRYTRHDAPASVRRAYTAAEVRQMAAAVGLREARHFRDVLGHRYALVLVRDS